MGIADSPAGAAEGWEQEVAFAKKVVDDFIFRLPEELRVEALRIGYELAKISEGYHAEGAMEQKSSIRKMSPFCTSWEGFIRGELRVFLCALQVSPLHRFNPF